MARAKETSDGITALETRTIKLEFPVSHDTDVFIVCTGPPPDKEGFLRMHAMLDLLESSMLGTPLKVAEKIVIKEVPAALPAPEKKYTGKKRGPKPRGEQRFRTGAKKGVWHKPQPERQAMIVREFIADGGKRTMYKLANDLKVPYTTLVATVNAARKRGLIPTSNDGGKDNGARAATADIVSSDNSVSEGVTS